MVKKPKRTSKMLALLMAVVMTVGSVPTTAFAANSSSIGASSSSLEGLFRLWQPYGYRLLCRKRNHLLDSRICSLGCQRLTKDRKHLSGGAFFIYRQPVWGGGFPVCTGFAIRRRTYCASTCPDPRNPLAGRFLQGGACVLSLKIWFLCGIIISYRYVYLLGIHQKIKSDTGGQLP